MNWSEMTASSQYGLSAAAPSSAKLDNSPGIATIAGPSASSNASPWHPDHPLFFFGALLAAAAGLIGVAGSARVGPAKASASLGKS